MTTVTLIFTIIAIQALVTLVLAKGFFSMHYSDAVEYNEQGSENN